MNKHLREIEIIVLSDIHLGAYGCHAEELLNYLKSIKPKMVILNGDIIDFWQFSKKNWTETNTKIVKYLLKLIGKGIPVYYLTGNHDELFRKYTGTEIGSFQIVDKLVLNINNEKIWFFHGDVFDFTMQHAKWLTQLGSTGYDILIFLNRYINKLLNAIGREKVSLSKKIKDSVKQAVSFINEFEATVCDIAIQHKYDRVVCGHIHKPVIKNHDNEFGKTIYMNSGDWIENLTSLEFDGNNWSLYNFQPTKHDESEQSSDNYSLKEIFNKIQLEILENA